MNLVEFSLSAAQSLGALLAACLAACLFFTFGGSIGLFLFSGLTLSGSIARDGAYSPGQAATFGWFVATFVVLPGVIGRYIIARRNLDAKSSMLAGLCISIATAYLIVNYLEVDEWLKWQLPVNTGLASYSLLHQGALHFPVRRVFGRKQRVKR